LPVFRRAYQVDAVPEFALARADVHLEMPAEVAREISRNAEHYPLRLLAVADEALTKVIGKQAKQVGTTALKEHWFAAPGQRSSR
jgi:hypothetical protein